MSSRHIIIYVDIKVIMSDESRKMEEEAVLAYFMELY
jgi:hypothetical protein